ncbi:penicillin acylase family protein [Pseudomarimonas salicorniae]|uniref:Penicillin acylase family protein n=1 Tax=Pseudomarimonas salicorniae TaxID=2933270 RepID=A0ABT0GDC3_9GAMM|nr:penicillin acylase family protein [Lysobacter sp. CAU 1642]
MSKSTPRLRALSLALLLTIGAGASGAQAQTAIPAPGLQANGTITYDSQGVPTITAASDVDAAWLMGYAHARDRFFQMDQLRRVASGTLAELFGQAALSSDVQFRTFGLRRAAQKSWEASPAALRGPLRAYADGVNAWLAQNASTLPIEYGALELTRAQPWSPVDSLVIGKLLALQLSFDDDTGYTARLGAYQQAGAAAGFNGAALFFEDTHRSAPADDRASIPGFFSDQNKSVRIKSDPNAGIDAEQLALLQTHVARVEGHPILGPLLNRRENRAGSNWWMVSGEHTASGRPILANDPHLSMDTPTLFHEAHIVSNDPAFPQPMNTAGLVAPGTPLPILGCTSDFCWGLTTNSLDVTDWYFEQFILNTYGLPTHSITNGVAEPVLWVFQSYFVNRFDGVMDNAARDNSIGYTNGAVTVLVPRRNFGPMLVAPNAQGQGITVQYAGWGSTFELEAFRKINRATNLEEFRQAVLNFDVGSQNFGYVDKAGNIAYYVSAEAPIRQDLQANTVNGLPPFLVRNGSGGNEWLPRQTTHPGQALPYEVLAPSEMPQWVNPAQGYIANANNDPVGATFDNNPLNQQRAGGGIYYLAPGGSPFRMGRIDRELQDLIARGNITVQDMARLQANTELLDAELVLPHLLNAFDNRPACPVANDAKVAEAIGYLRDWDLSHPTGIQQGYDAGDNPFALAAPSETEIANSVAATLFTMFRSQAIRGTIDHTLGQVGLGSFRPGGTDAYTALIHHLKMFPSRQGRGASGLDFFTRVPSGVAANAPAATRRDCILLDSLKRGIDRLASNDFAPAFGNSTNLRDYRWGRLHRIVFDHPLGDPLSIPSDNGYPFTNLAPGLPGLARPGGFQAVDASSHDVRGDGLNSFMFGSGPIRRFIGEMTDTPTLLQVIPGGQDGKIGGPGYISQLPLWLVNGYKPLVIDPQASAASAVATLQFSPR